ncbi:protein FAM161A [Bombina bombina]|uniref:protein FAM161A n=1 Tax=Bombina bombina TaxID=8345 RepID=UPI00235AE774|nr:protein FAM161A [Bombina bombina]
MAVSHRESVLTSSCIQPPVNPRTRAPITLYERQEEERKQPRSTQPDYQDSEDSSDEEHSKNWKCKNWVLDISKICDSDTGYYMQLERLKNAHLHSMDDLQKMYENKLYLKGVQSINTEQRCDVVRSAWEQPVEFDKCFLKPDYTGNVSSGLSDSSRIELTDEEHSSDSESVSSARERIGQMWNGFSVDDYIKNLELDTYTKGKARRKKSKEWSHKITIPQPFSMMTRETKKKEMNAKSKSEIELDNLFLKKKLEEEAECQKKFRANPVPASVFLPLYHEIVERNEERRRFVKERSKEILLASQKPFQFIEREERKKEFRKFQLMKLPASVKSSSHFKAKPVPKFIYGSTASERSKEEELYRGIRTHMRAQELLCSSSYPTAMLAPKASMGNTKLKCYIPKDEQKHKPNINTCIPNFKALHQKQEEQILKNKKARHVTICDSFHLRTGQIASHKEKILRDIEVDEEQLKETRWPYRSPRHQEQIKPYGVHLSPCEEAPTPRSTESSKRRQQAIRNHEKQKTKQYLEDLVAMEERVSRKPLLFERAMQKNARLAAEKHYTNVLKRPGAM